jgi:hypothetical protein
MNNKLDKRLSMTYNMNNFKLKTLLAIKKEKTNIKETAKELKQKVYEWNQVTRSLILKERLLDNQDSMQILGLIS